MSIPTSEKGFVSRIWHERERVRVKRHIAGGLRAARSGQPMGLTEMQVSRRQSSLNALERYVAAEVFPHNECYRVRTPYFRDSSGAICAVGYMIESSGDFELADNIAESHNNIRLTEETTPALDNWIAANGLTKKEAARIQPSYCNESLESSLGWLSAGQFLIVFFAIQWLWYTVRPSKPIGRFHAMGVSAIALFIGLLVASVVPVGMLCEILPQENTL